MSMADNQTFRSQGSSDSYRRAAEPTRLGEPPRASDPLAELARLIGQSGSFGQRDRTEPRMTEHWPDTDQVTPKRDEWQRPQDYRSDDAPAENRENYRDFAHSFGHEPYGDVPPVEDNRYDEAHREPEQYDDGYADDR